MRRRNRYQPYSRNYNDQDFLQAIEKSLFYITSEKYSHQLSKTIKGIRSIMELYRIICEAPPDSIDIVIITQLINKLAYKKFELAKQIFALASKFGAVTNVTTNSYIKAAGMCNNFGEAKRALNIALSLDLDHDKDFRVVKRAFDTAIKRKFIDGVTINTYLNAAGECKRFSEAQAPLVFNIALKLGLVNLVTTCSYIKAAGMCNNFGEAKRALDIVLDLDLNHVETFNEAKRAFDSAIVSKLVDGVTICTYLNAAGGCKRFSEAQAPLVFNIALELRLVDLVTTNSYIKAAGMCNNLLLKGGKFKEAALIFRQAYPNFIRDQNNLFDLHGFNFATAYIACCEIAKSGNISFTLIVGKGLHSNKESVVKTAAEQFCEDHNVMMTIDPKNPGQIHCQLQDFYNPSLSTFGFFAQRSLAQNEMLPHDFSYSYVPNSS